MLTLELPPRKTRTAFNLRRWAELLADRGLAKVEGRIETDRYGHIIMSPPPAPSHGSFQSERSHVSQQYRGGNSRENGPLLRRRRPRGLALRQGWRDEFLYCRRGAACARVKAVSPVSQASEAALSFPPAARPQATFRSTLQLRQEPSLGWRLRGVRPEVRPPSAWSWSLRGNALFCGPAGHPRFDHSPARAALKPV